MRRALNENPLVQVAFLGVAAVVLAAVFLIRMGGGSEPATTPASTPAPSASTPAPAPTESATATSPAPTQSGPASGSAPTPASASTPAESELEGLPAAYARAAASGRPIAIFVVRGKPVSDKVIKGYAHRLEAEGGVSVFVIHPRDLADWVRVVGTVGVDRTPALVVVAPSNGSGTATAEVSYGFRNFDSVRQAIADSRYDGPVRGYDPG